jgi:fibronectin-binding autotransporter adhesin
VTFDGVISGNGAVEKAGSGTTILTADNSYNGGTTITAGTLQLG